MAATIKEPTSGYKRPDEHSPEPGQYDANIGSFGSNAKSFKIGEKTQENYDPNLGPGYYQADAAQDRLSRKTTTAIIREESN